MVEYMSREDYCEETCGIENREGYKTCHNCGMLNVPLVDVQPVKRGRWMKCGKLEGKIVMKCSVCEQGITEMFAPKYHYCPNCGARMDDDAK